MHAIKVSLICRRRRDIFLSSSKFLKEKIDINGHSLVCSFSSVLKQRVGNDPASNIGTHVVMTTLSPPSIEKQTILIEADPLQSLVAPHIFSKPAPVVDISKLKVTELKVALKARGEKFTGLRLTSSTHFVRSMPSSIATTMLRKSHRTRGGYRWL